MTYEKMELRQFDATSLKASKDDWLLDATKGLAFYTEVERLYDWAATHLELSQTDATAFGVFQRGKKSALALCEITVQRKSVRSKWVKMLRMHLSPAIDFALQRGDSLQAMNVFRASLQGTLSLQMLHKATTLKVYGRTNEQLAFLSAVVANIETKLADSVKEQAKVSIDGRFLSIEVK